MVGYAVGHAAPAGAAATSLAAIPLVLAVGLQREHVTGPAHRRAAAQERRDRKEH